MRFYTESEIYKRREIESKPAIHDSKGHKLKGSLERGFIP